MSHDEPAPVGKCDLQVIPDPALAKAAVAERSTVGWHFHRWTAWEEGRVWNTGRDGSRVPTDVQHRRCTKCRKLKISQYLKKVRH